MLDWILLQGYRNTLPLQTVHQLRRSAKSWTLLRPTNCLQPTRMPVLIEMNEYKNSGLVVILHCLSNFNATTTWHFHYLYVLLEENRKIDAICFPSFHNGCNHAYKVGRRLRTGEWSILVYFV